MIVMLMCTKKLLLSQVPDTLQKKPALLSQWLNHLDIHRLKGGVLVQVSFLGNDNSQLCAALESLDENYFAGVAVVSLNASDEEFERLSSVGVKGFRWNLVTGADITDLKDPLVRSFLERIYARDMHIEIHLESPRLAGIINPLLSFGGKVVIDHLGLPTEQDPAEEPWLQAIKKSKELSGLYVKLSGSYRTSFDTHQHAQAIVSQLQPNRVIWGSDWPHTQHEGKVNYYSIANSRLKLPISSDSTAVQTLYGLKSN